MPGLRTDKPAQVILQGLGFALPTPSTIQCGPCWRSEPSPAWGAGGHTSARGLPSAQLNRSRFTATIAAFYLLRQLAGIPEQPACPIGQPFQASLLIPLKDLVADLGGYPEFPPQRCHDRRL